jgi:hypothetical protein
MFEATMSDDCFSSSCYQRFVSPTFYLPLTLETQIINYKLNYRMRDSVMLGPNDLNESAAIYDKLHPRFFDTRS